MDAKKIMTVMIMLCVFKISAQIDIDVIQPDFGENPTFAGKYDLQNWNSEIDYYDQFLAIAKMEGSDVKGDKYLNSDFSKGFIINNDNKTKAKGSLRYNIYNQAFELLLNENSNNVKQLTKSFNYEFILNNEKFVLVDNHLLNSKLPENTYGYIVEILKSDSKASLYKKYQLQFEIGYWGSNHHYSKKDDSKISNVQSYYILMNDEFKKLELNKNKVIRLFKDSKKEIENFVEAKGFNFRGDDEKISKELLQVVRYYNSL